MQGRHDAERPPLMERVSEHITHWTGSTTAFAVAAGLIVAWIASGPLFHFSDTWQLVVNTSTTIVTFLMVFLLQRAQNKDSKAVAMKLNELIAALEGASNTLIGAEDFSERELALLGEHFRTLARLARKDLSLTASHSVGEAERRHRVKRPPVAHR